MVYLLDFFYEINLGIFGEVFWKTPYKFRVESQEWLLVKLILIRSFGASSDKTPTVFAKVIVEENCRKILEGEIFEET